MEPLLSLELVDRWKQHRPALLDLAFRMLGDIGEAEDVVQEAFIRLAAADGDPIRDDRGWLIVVTSRLCLDRARSAQSRRETPFDFLGRDPSSVVLGRSSLDPADRVTLDDSVRTALLVLIDQMTPAERVVFVLHEVFQMPFADIGETVGRSTAACRQLLRRARLRLVSEGASPRTEIAADHRLLTERFIQACSSGDVTELLALLDPDVSGTVELAADGTRLRVVHGASNVARNTLNFWGRRATLVSLPFATRPLLLGFVHRRLAALISLTVDAETGRVTKIHVLPVRASH